ncbi:WD repeat and coiled-coil-containing protein [Larimichthys crocea]|uniref:WD repeat and coiled-coil-containing protein n=1 Tax=Larimichthys crocea TaxID=215358 RepID=A0A6G0I6R3_LARCR|nr:WD repeat and coiled-coil-containing protein [Larimichthys crocea]
MDLGKAKLLRTGLNTLHQAIHPVHGIAWTDGKQVCLTSLYCINGEVKFGDTNVIGQFEHVFGLFWGPSAALTPLPCWLFSTRNILDILAVLTKRDTSVLFSVRVDNRRTKADIKGSGLIHCACWTKDGTRLVVAIGSALHSYIWNDIQKILVACSFCPIFDVGGYICAIEATAEAQVAVATELPLDKLCGLNAGMAFDMPTEAESLQGHGSHGVYQRTTALWIHEGDHLNHRTGRTSLAQALWTSPNFCLSTVAPDPSPLIHLRRRDTMTGSGQDSSHLILVTYERKVTTTRKVSIPGILVPDIVAFDPRGFTVAVASNTCNMVLVYCITASAMPNIQQISLDTREAQRSLLPQ